MTHEELQFTLALKEIKKIKGALINQLIREAGSAKAAFGLSREKLIGLKTPRELIIALKNARISQTILDELLYVQKNRVSALGIMDSEYPALLHNCQDAPVLLFGKGNCMLGGDRPFISIVGTREATGYGMEMTELIVKELKPYDPVIVSGLATGIDSAAHRAALKHGLRTVAIVGNGLSVMFPSENIGLANEICENDGCVLTEYLHDTPARAGNFPVRNRVVAGMSMATLVIEAKAKGGALITANMALGYNRELFAVPGRVGDKSSEGCNELIRQNKAALISSPEEFISELSLMLPKKEITANERQTKQTELFPELSEDENLIIDALKTKEKVHIDDIAFALNCPVYKIAGSLLSLELKGLIEVLPAKYYSLA